VKKKMVEYELSRSHRSLFLKNKHTISQSPESLPSMPKQQCIMSDETPTPMPTRYCAPNPISGTKFTHKLAPAATWAIKGKAPAAAREQELIECYNSNSGLEFSDPIPFDTLSSVPSISRSASAASTSTATSSNVGSTRNAGFDNSFPLFLDLHNTSFAKAKVAGRFLCCQDR